MSKFQKRTSPIFTFQANIRASTLATLLGVVIAAFLIVHLLLGAILMRYGMDVMPLTIVRLFNVNEEGNLPTWFSATLLFICALRLIHVGLRSHSRRLYWFAAALLLLYMSMDESAALHEIPTKPLGRLLGLEGDGLFSFAWVIPGTVAMVVVAFFFFPFWRGLARRLRLRLTLATILFLGGALGVEAVSGHFASGFVGFAAEMRSWPTLLLTALEEGLEMVGAALLLVTLLTTREFEAEREEVRSSINRHLPLERG